jgi:putative ABC transport system permease protein
MLTVFLISSTLIMQKQLNHIQTVDLGYDKEAMIEIKLYQDPNAQSMLDGITSGFENGKLLKQALATEPKISNISMSNHMFGSEGWTELGFNDKEKNFREFSLLVVDPYFLTNFGIKMKAGRNFDLNQKSDERESIILNQAAVDYFGFDDPIGQKLDGERFENHKIIGVTENFNFASLHNKVTPLIITQNHKLIFGGVNSISISDSPIPKLTLKYSGGNLEEIKSIIEKHWNATFPNEELRYSFLDENLADMYRNEARISKVVSIATVLSMIIASLGLLGITILVVNKRVKEIGIRKIMGASPVQIFLMLFKNFSLQLAMAFALSIPITIYLMNGWLLDFAYRIEIGFTTFLLSMIVAFGFTVVVISYHALKAAHQNPVNALRAE